MYPGAEERCNEKDDNCDGRVDEGFDFMTSQSHCGRCDLECSEWLRCRNGTCSCDDALTACEEQCVNLQTDISNCGRCGNECGCGAGCRNGECVILEEGLTWCEAGGCVNLQSDQNNCGECGNECPPNSRCEDAECGACPEEREVACHQVGVPPNGNVLVAGVVTSIAPRPLITAEDRVRLVFYSPENAVCRPAFYGALSICDGGNFLFSNIAIDCFTFLSTNDMDCPQAGEENDRWVETLTSIHGLPANDRGRRENARAYLISQADMRQWERTAREFTGNNELEIYGADCTLIHITDADGIALQGARLVHSNGTPVNNTLYFNDAVNGFEVETTSASGWLIVTPMRLGTYTAVLNGFSFRSILMQGSGPEICIVYELMADP